MTTAFAVQGPSMVLTYTDDSSDVREIIPQDGLGIPNALFIVNPDSANVIVVSVCTASLKALIICLRSGRE